MTTEQKIEQLIEIGNTLQINLNTPKGEALLSAIQALTAIDNIRTEIEQMKEKAEINYGHQLSFDKIYAYNKCLEIIAKYMEDKI